VADTIGVIGAGSWGTTLANLFAEKGHAVTLWTYEPSLCQIMKEKRENSLYLPHITLSERIAPTTSITEACLDKDLLVFVTPSQALRNVASQTVPHLTTGLTFAIASKGIENSTLLPMSAVMKDVLPVSHHGSIAVLSGPSFASEVSRKMPTAVCVASDDEGVAQKVQKVLATTYFRVYTNPDPTGVELGGALKNVIAIAAGMSDGLGFGHNARAALITRGLREIARLGTHMGARPQTFSGLSGLGDLVLTCTGELSRNRSVGLRIAQGAKLKDILEGMKEVAEGIHTTLAAYHLSRKHKIDMPITEQTYAILYQDKPAKDAVYELMGRHLKDE
jgi:glycerol-3-phosphate dehydrogenase (NAD(P)+)